MSAPLVSMLMTTHRHGPRTSRALGGQDPHRMSLGEDSTVIWNQRPDHGLRPTKVDAGDLAARPSTHAHTRVGA